MVASIRNISDPVSEDNIIAGGLAPSLADATMDLISEVQGGYSALNIANAKANFKAMLILGFASPLCLFTGPILAKRGLKEIKVGAIFKDTLGEIIGFARTGTGIFQTCAGAAYMGMAIASLVFFVTTIQTAFTAAQVLSIIGGGFYGVGSSLALFSGFVELYIGVQCLKILKSAGDNPEKILQTLCFTCSDPKQKCLFQRVLGKELLKKVLEKDPSVSEGEVAREIQKQIRHSLIKGGLWTLISLISSTISILALIITSITAQYAFAAASLVMGILWVAFDIQEFSSCYANNPVSNWEKFWVVASCVLCFIIIGVSLALCTHPAMMGLIVATGLTLGIIHLLSIYKACFN